MRSVGQLTEIGRDVFTLRYRFYDQQIGVVVGADGILVVDTRSTQRQGQEIVDDLKQVTTLPIRAVINTHFHYDHTFGNHVFRPAPIWGHERCAARLAATGEGARERMILEEPELADDLRQVVVDPPDRTFDERTIVDGIGRDVELRYIGRGHTDNDIVVLVPDDGTLFAGDLLENGATPYFGDGFPIDWPATADTLAALVQGTVVPGHGDAGDRSLAERQATEFHELAALARRVRAGEIGFDDALGASPYPAKATRVPLERALLQLGGELDG
jgi:glyoxylase-like metal-dependent hydrolase (beta-lactamase superfamily II)